jgi:chromosome partitioning protein
MTKIIALFNQAGGVAKSTVTQNLGYHLGLKDHSVLLVDMDPQASLTSFMGLDPASLDKTVLDALINEEPLFIQSDIYGISLAPSNIHLSAAEITLVNLDFREVRLKNALIPIKETFDFILIDCPPSLGILSYISLIAATHVLVPIETQFKSFLGTNLLLDTVSRIKKRGNPELSIAGFLPTKFSANNTQDQRTLNAIQEQLSPYLKVFEPIKRSTAFADASEQMQPLALYQPKHPALQIFEEIAIYLEQLS